MITIDALKVMFYIQLATSAVLFFVLQLAALARNPEKLIDWLAYRSTWGAVVIQCVFLAIVGVLVWSGPSDPVMVAHCVLLHLMNLAWFISLRLTFELADARQ